MENTGSHDVQQVPNGTSPEFIGTSQILVCLDRSEPSKAILSYAIMLTRVIDAKLTLMHVVESRNQNSSSCHDALKWELKHQEACQYMQELLKLITGLKIPANMQIAEGRAAEQILRYIRQHHVDFVVLASHGAHGLTEWSISSTASKIIGRTHSSFVIIPATPDYQSAELESTVQKILVPLDDSLPSQAALPIAIRIAKHQNAELILAHAIEPASFHRHSGLKHSDREIVKSAESILESVARDYFGQIAARLESEGVKVSVIVRSDINPISLIAETIAARSVDFVVMSAHGSSTNEQYPLARTSSHMASHTPVPLLMVQDLDEEQIARALPKRCYDSAPLPRGKPISTLENTS